MLSLLYLSGDGGGSQSALPRAVQQYAAESALAQPATKAVDVLWCLPGDRHSSINPCASGDSKRKDHAKN